MRKSFLLLVLFLSQSFVMIAGSHNTPKRLLLVDENKANGTFKWAYEYEVGIEKPITDWDWEEAKAIAQKKCESWGYRTVQFPKRGQRTCAVFSDHYDPYCYEPYCNKAYCDKIKITYKCQCIE